MAIIGRLHPLLIHFPIALVATAVLAEAVAAFTRRPGWQAFAAGNVRVAAAFVVVAAYAGWRLALDPVSDAGPVLEWHRWLGVSGAAATVAAAVLSPGLTTRAAVGRWPYRLALVSAGALVTIAAHLGGLMVWGADFLHF